jgi:hypothetical protein
MLLAVTALAFLGAAVFLLFGNWLADTLHGTDVTAGTGGPNLTPGQDVTIVAKVTGAAGYLAAPAAAAVVYWACSLFAPDTAFER